MRSLSHLSSTKSNVPGLLVNVAAAIGQMAEDVESLEQVVTNHLPWDSGDQWEHTLILLATLDLEQ